MNRHLEPDEDYGDDCHYDDDVDDDDRDHDHDHHNHPRKIAKV